MINAIFKAAFAAIIIILAIILGASLAQLFAIISVGGPSIAFAIAGSAFAAFFAWDFVKNEVYGEY